MGSSRPKKSITTLCRIAIVPLYPVILHLCEARGIEEKRVLLKSDNNPHRLWLFYLIGTYGVICRTVHSMLHHEVPWFVNGIPLLLGDVPVDPNSQRLGYAIIRFTGLFSDGMALTVSPRKPR